MAAASIEGIFVPNLTLLDAHGQIDEREMRRYISWLIAEGAHGLYPNGSTGEFTRFTAEERRRIIAIVADETRGRVPILAGAAEANVSETLAACEYYAGLGVRSAAIVAPFYFRLSPDNVYAYFKEIGDRAPLDITLYNIPLFASPIDVATVARLAEECPRIVAIKDSSGDMTHMLRMIQAVRPRRPDFRFLTGYDGALLPMLLCGCAGGTNAVAGIAPALTRRLYELACREELSEAREVQFQILELFDAIISGADFPEGVRLALEMRGFRPGRGRMPLSVEHVGRLKTLRPRLERAFAAAGIQIPAV